jgi:hypothetical protein
MSYPDPPSVNPKLSGRRNLSARQYPAQGLNVGHFTGGFIRQQFIKRNVVYRLSQKLKGIPDAYLAIEQRFMEKLVSRSVNPQSSRPKFYFRDDTNNPLVF